MQCSASLNVHWFECQLRTGPGSNLDPFECQFLTGPGPNLDPFECQFLTGPGSNLDPLQCPRRSIMRSPPVISATPTPMQMICMRSLRSFSRPSAVAMGGQNHHSDEKDPSCINLMQCSLTFRQPQNSGSTKRGIAQQLEHHRS